MPNMDDVWLSVMHSAMDQRSASGPSGGSSGEPGASELTMDSSSQP